MFFERSARVQRTVGWLRRAAAWIVLGLCGICAPAFAGYWLEAGDAGLRSDVEILAARGLIDPMINTWPVPAGVFRRLIDERARVAHEPEYVRRAAQRVLAYLDVHGNPDSFRPAAAWRMTNRPDPVRGFDTLARDRLDVRGGFDWNIDPVSITVRSGTQAHLGGGDHVFSLDGTSISAVLGNWQIYSGWVDQWYGGGWNSSLILSTNARPFPKLGLMRYDPHAFETPWLAWIGPWQLNLFVGLLDGPRIDRNTALGSLRLSFSPIHGLEIALARLTEFCGTHHSCNPVNAAFHVNNNNQDPNATNDEASIELKYTTALGALTLSPYLQFMNEDTGPFTHSDTSYLAGASAAGPWGGDGAHWRLTAEYADSVSTLNWFSFGRQEHGQAYNNVGYFDGYRYRSRTLGLSLDSDSRLFSFTAALTDSANRVWRLAYHHADISTSELAAQQAAGGFYNVVSAQPVTINQAEAGVTLHWDAIGANFALRWQDHDIADEPGGRVAAEIGLQYGF